MRWRGRKGSTNVEDRRGSGRLGGGMMRGGRPVGFGCGGLLLVGIIALLFGADPQQLLEVLEQTQVSTQQPLPDALPGGRSGTGGAIGDELGQFASVVLADTEATWGRIFAAAGYRYEEPAMVLFSGSVRSACGFSSAATGPFYCPADRKVYIDLSFFNELERRFGAPGDFAQAYVIAHEVGHHVQNLLGLSSQVDRARRGMSRQRANQLSIAMELQADCYAGVWGYHARQLLEPGDIEEGLRAAEVIGDDAIQRHTTGTVQPESWTHGSSRQRVAWLRRGLESGDEDQCDTFSR